MSMITVFFTLQIEDENDWEYVEEGPAEIIWQGNEIIVKKKKVKVPKKKAEQRTIEEVLLHHLLLE